MLESSEPLRSTTRKKSVFLSAVLLCFVSLISLSPRISFADPTEAGTSDVSAYVEYYEASNYALQLLREVDFRFQDLESRENSRWERNRELHRARTLLAAVPTSLIATLGFIVSGNFTPTETLITFGAGAIGAGIMLREAYHWQRARLALRKWTENREGLQLETIEAFEAADEILFELHKKIQTAKQESAHDPEIHWPELRNGEFEEWLNHAESELERRVLKARRLEVFGGNERSFAEFKVWLRNFTYDEGISFEEKSRRLQIFAIFLIAKLSLHATHYEVARNLYNGVYVPLPDRLGHFCTKVVRGLQTRQSSQAD